jgi:hypothetical protein
MPNAEPGARWRGVLASPHVLPVVRISVVAKAAASYLISKDKDTTMPELLIDFIT